MYQLDAAYTSYLEDSAIEREQLVVTDSYYTHSDGIV